MPLESTYLTPRRFSKTFFLPWSARFRMESRKLMLPSPIRTSPLRSRMVTSPACRSFTSSSAMTFSVQRDLTRALLLEAVECLGFAFVNVEDSQELRDRQQVLKFLGEIEQLELSTFFVDGSVTGNKLADAARINVSHPSKVKKNALLAFFEQTPDGGAQRHASLADRYLSAHVKNRDISGLTLVDIQLSHFRNLL